MPELDLSKGPIAGMQGRFYWPSGDPMGECKSWQIAMTHESTDERTLGRWLSVPVEQGGSMALRFSQLTITDEIPRQMLEAARAGKQLFLDFYAEVHRNDGQVSKYPVTRCTPDGETILFGAEAGTTMARDFSWKVADLPEPTQYLT